MRSILAGIFIGLAGFVYLAVGGIAGASLFAFGLTCVVLYRLNLYTGKAGVYSTKKIHELLFMFIMNAVGCGIIALLASLQINMISDNLGTIIDARQAAPLMKVFILSIGTGVIMEAAVQHSARAEKPNFIPHCYCTKRICSKNYTRTNLKKLGLPVRPIYQVVYQYANKANYIKGVCDVLIDDSWRNVKQCLESGFPALLITRPHNKHISTKYRINHLNYQEISKKYYELF